MSRHNAAGVARAVELVIPLFRVRRPTTAGSWPSGLQCLANTGPGAYARGRPLQTDGPPGTPTRSITACSLISEPGSGSGSDSYARAPWTRPGETAHILEVVNPSDPLQGVSTFVWTGRVMLP